MISYKKSVTKNDWIIYFKDVVEVNKKFNFKHPEQKLSLKQEAVIKQKKNTQREKFSRIVLKLNYLYLCSLHEI